MSSIFLLSMVAFAGKTYGQSVNASMTDVISGANGGAVPGAAYPGEE